MIRKFIVKNFALSYRFKTFGRTFSSLRASRIIAPLFFISGILTVINPEYPKITWYTGISYGLTLISLYFGFIYFSIWPVKREELDDDQKRQWDDYYETK